MIFVNFVFFLILVVVCIFVVSLIWMSTRIPFFFFWIITRILLYKVNLIICVQVHIRNSIIKLKVWLNNSSLVNDWSYLCHRDIMDGLLDGNGKEREDQNIYLSISHLMLLLIRLVLQSLHNWLNNL